MQVIQKVVEMQRKSLELKRDGKSIGFVATMGALHEGHLSLVRAAKKENDAVIVSIFVNPTQFGADEDFLEYPRDFERDKKLLQKKKVDMIFHPSVEEMYGKYQKKDVNKRPKHYQVPHPFKNCLCGKFRPGHLDGVAQIVEKLFRIIVPHRAYFGQKDYQQTVVIRRLVKDLKLPIRIRIMPTIRESDGLAISSRNIYVTKDERKKATILYEALRYGQKRAKNKKLSLRLLEDEIKELIHQKMTTNQNIKFQLQYAEIRDAKNLTRIRSLKKNAVLALAAKFGKTRLIDNIILVP